MQTKLSLLSLSVVGLLLQGCAGARTAASYTGRRFQDFDTDHDGRITFAEFSALIDGPSSGSESHKRPSKAASLFHQIDQNDDGAIVPEEFDKAPISDDEGPGHHGGGGGRHGGGHRGGSGMGGGGMGGFP